MNRNRAITTTDMPHPEGDGSGRIGPAALVTARWALFAVALGLVGAQLWRPGLWGEQPLGDRWVPLAAVVLWGGVNLHAARRARRGGADARPEEAGVHLLLDVAMLTALLASTGGASNPFTMLYFLPITLATLVSRSWTWIVALAAVCGFAVLVVVSTWTMQPVMDAASGHGHHAGHDQGAHGAGGHYWRHLVGMGVALAVAGSLVTYFVHGIAGVLAQQRSELERLRREAREDRYVASLGALSAGAAHELGTPLGTIQLLAGELEWMDEEERRDAARLIRSELERCKDILHGMKNPELSARALEQEGSWSLEELCGELRGIEVPPSTRLQVRFEGDGAEGTCEQPRAVIEQTVRELVTNALRARVEGRPMNVEVLVSRRGEELGIDVVDDGRGMDPEELASAMEPFFSKSSEGRGLGLFLAGLHVRQLGGTLSLQSEVGRGTRAELRLPRRPPAPLLRVGGGRSAAAQEVT